MATLEIAEVCTSPVLYSPIETLPYSYISSCLGCARVCYGGSVACFYSTIVQSERDSQVCKESRISVVKEPSLFINVNALLYLQRSLHVTVKPTHLSLGVNEYADATRDKALHRRLAT